MEISDMCEILLNALPVIIADRKQKTKYQIRLYQPFKQFSNKDILPNCKPGIDFAPCSNSLTFLSRNQNKSLTSHAWRLKRLNLQEIQ